ncbi:endonuclease III [Sessilibacter sp. MAH4]
MNTDTVATHPQKNLTKPERVAFILRRLNELYPEPPIPLDHTDSYTLLVAVLLSAQCTDERVNKVTPGLWKLANNPFDMAKQSVEDIQAIIRPCGLSPQKSKAILKLSQILVEDYDGKVPGDMEKLEQLPGVGHKTAGVVMAQAFGVPAFPVDTHIHRLAQRWGLTNGKNVTQTERDLKKLFPKDSWNKLHLQIIYYGREFCSARGCDGRVCEICTTCYPNRKHPKKVLKP